MCFVLKVVVFLGQVFIVLVCRLVSSFVLLFVLWTRVQGWVHVVLSGQTQSASAEEGAVENTKGRDAKSGSRCSPNIHPSHSKSS